jgi:hypothetical protein
VKLDDEEEEYAPNYSKFDEQKKEVEAVADG